MEHRRDARSAAPAHPGLGYAYLSSLSLPEVALPHLENLVASVHESSSVSVLDGTEIVYVARVADQADHDPPRSAGHPVAGVRDVDGPGAAGRSPDEAGRLPGLAPLRPLTPYTLTDVERCGPSCDRYDGRAGRWSTRSWRRGCARWPRRCTIPSARWWRPSTCRPVRGAGRPRPCRRRSCPGCWRRGRHRVGPAGRAACSAGLNDPQNLVERQSRLWRAVGGVDAANRLLIDSPSCVRRIASANSAAIEQVYIWSSCRGGGTVFVRTTSRTPVPGAGARWLAR